MNNPSYFQLQEVATGTIGFQLFETTKVYGQLDGFNIDGAGGKKKLSDYYLMVRSGTDNTGNPIGCTAAKIA